MKLFVALTALVATLSAVSANPFAAVSKNDAKAKYMSKLMRGAVETPNSQLHRSLDQEDYVVDISAYAIKFEQCQFVKTYSDELAEKEDFDTVLETQRFVIFRLCPTENSSGGTETCGTCNSNYGEYLIDLDSYLEATVEYYQQEQESMCQACEETCQNNNQNQDNQQDDQAQDDGGRRRKLQDCSTCMDECYKIENMEAAGYIDATEFLECQMIYDPEDDGGEALYAGPMCASSGTKIKIGVFKDELCSIHDESKEVDEYIVDGEGVQMKLSHALLKNTYSTEQCISCTVVQDNGRRLDQNMNEVADICDKLYEDAAKCEKTHGFDNGYANYDGYENQLSQEAVVCDYMASLTAGTYAENGEIVVTGKSSSFGGGSSTTGGQKFALAFFIIGTVGLAAYAAVLHSKLTKGGKADLSRQGGAMA